MFGVTYRHLESIGTIEETHPWRSDTWYFFKFSLSHWQNLKHIPYMSSPTSRHIWSLFMLGKDWRLSFKYGTVPFRDTEI